MATWVVTGASSGLGLEMVKQLAARGDKIFATVRSKKSSATGEDEISALAAAGDVTIIEGVDATNDAVGDVLKASALAGVTIDCVIHNAGSLNATRDVASGELFADQTLTGVSMDRMRACFELNTLGPLRMQQAFLPQMKSPGGKVAIISTGMGSIGDNGSGGIYAYRTSKAAVNMVAKNMSCDLKDKGIAVTPINPGMVQTGFGAGKEAMEKMGAMPVDISVKGILSVIDGLSMENTGKYMSVSKDGSSKEFQW